MADPEENSRLVPKWVPVVGALGLLSATGLTGGVIEAKTHVLRNLKDAAIRWMDAPPEDDPRATRRVVFQSALHALEVLDFPVTPEGEPIVIAEYDGRLLFSTLTGALGWFDPATGDIARAETSVPMDWDRFTESEMWKDPMLFRPHYRTHDLFVNLPGDQAYLYATHHRYRDECIEFFVSRIPMAVDGNAITFGADWESVYVADPCIKPKKLGTAFAGHQSGGRIVSPEPGRLLVSLGDFEFDGIHGEPAPMDPGSDLGKILEIDAETGAARHFASGVRNPQGLMVAADGRIWETEHGPQGGDELNLIRDGAVFGWPDVTYGMLYGFPVRDWPRSTAQGRHPGFEKPVYAFVPSIGISNLVEAEAGQFPLWEGDLIISSLKAKTLYRVRLEGDRVVYVEPIALPKSVAQRIRDIIVLADGRLAASTDDGHILLIGNGDDADPDAVPAVARVPAPEPAAFRIVDFEPRGNDRDARIARGRQVFEQRCATCHRLNEVHDVGPHLAALLGRPVGGAEGFGYSDALRQADDVWSRDLLLAFLSDPNSRWEGTSMSRVFLTQDQYEEVTLFLASLAAPDL